MRVDLLGLARRAGFGQALGELGERGLVAGAQSLDHGAFLLCAFLGVTVQADFCGVLADPSVQMQRVPGRGGEGLGDSASTRACACG